jgi:glucose-1-phosphate thymidylyltransferase
MKALITAGGKGTRMRPLTFSTNKHFIPLANKPLLFYAIEEIVEAGIREIGINYNPGQLEEIKSYLGDGGRWGVNFTYIFQEAPLGLAHIIKISEFFLGKDSFVMHLGDNIFYGGIKPLIETFVQSGANAMASIIHHKENSRMAVPYFDAQGKLLRFEEKPENPPNDFGGVGLYFFDHNVFKCFEGEDQIKPSKRGELEIVSPYNWLIDHGYKVEVHEFTGDWLDPGKFDDWIETNRFLLDHALQEGSETSLAPGVRVEGKVKIGKNCQIENSSFQGPVIVGDNVIIKDSTLGPYCSISDDCEITGANLENTILEKAVKVSCPSKKITDSLIGDGTVIESSDSLSLFVGNQCTIKI